MVATSIVLAGVATWLLVESKGDKWKVTGIDLLDQPLSDGESAPKC